ncbi:hypothetical protein SAMD00024442_22_33 [Candidatus Symbiothrix dinenymphae]|nr:hypothetical protein SAMD00024442_22_33 [Candidatus Symbiothrix dinenymphae]
MNTKEKVQQLIELMGTDWEKKYCTELHDVLWGYSAKELEETAMVLERAYSKENTPEHELLKLMLQCRKQKLNAEFVFTPENTTKILRLNEQLMDCLEKLRQEAEQETVYLNQKKAGNNAFLHDYEIDCNIHPFIYVKDEETGEMQEATEGIDGLLHLMWNEYMLQFHAANDDLREHSLYFNKELNWNECDMPGNGELADFYIGYGIHELVDHSLFSLSDIVRINFLWGEVTTRQQHFVELF